MFDKKEWSKQYYIKNRERELERGQKWRESNVEHRKQYRIENHKKLLECNKKYYRENAEKCKKMNRQWRKNNPEKARELDRQWAKNNLEKHKEYQKQYRKTHHEENRKYVKAYYQKNKEKASEYRRNNIVRINKNRREWHKNRRKTNLKFNLNCRMSRGIHHSLKSNKIGHRWEAVVDYTIVELIKHLMQTIPKGYTWNDFLKGKFHIDHIIPKRVFNFTEPEHIDFKRCWGLSNLRLLLIEDNLKKGSKLTKPFQPALSIKELEKVIV